MPFDESGSDRGVPTVALLLMLIGCAPVTDARHTFAWEPNPQMGGKLDDSIAGQDIHAAVNDALEAHGRSPDSSPAAAAALRSGPGYAIQRNQGSPV
jgi:hypothetical protein